LKSIITVFIGLLVSYTSICNASEGDEEITRALIIVRLLNQIEWQQPDFVQKSDSHFNLCLYENPSTSRLFKRHLKQVSVFEKPIRVNNIKQGESIEACHGLYLKSTSEKTINKFVQDNLHNRTILVAEGIGSQKSGAHINLSLNSSGFFDFELNPAAFVASDHSINTALFRLGRVNQDQIAEKSKLLGFLLNYTEWPNDKSPAESSENFQLCSYKNNPFALFAEYFLAQKTIKKKSVALKIISKQNQLAGCQVLLLKQKQQDLNWLMQSRQTLGLLLVGNSSGMGEMGAHYNLSTRQTSSGRRFEINLLAFGMTEHVPNYQLLNSALVIKNDYPAIANLLSQIIRLTGWPEPLNETQKNKDTFELCVYGELQAVMLKDYLSIKLQSSKELKVTSLDGYNLPSANDKFGCEVIFVETQSQQELTQALDRQTESQVLLITNQLTPKYINSNQNNKLMPIHFNLLTKSKMLSFEVFIKNLRQSGFSPAKKLLEAAVINRGNGHD